MLRYLEPPQSVAIVTFQVDQIILAYTRESWISHLIDSYEATYQRLETGHHICPPPDDELVFPCPECKLYWDQMISQGLYRLGHGWTDRALNRKESFTKPLNTTKKPRLELDMARLARKFGLS